MSVYKKNIDKYLIVSFALILFVGLIIGFVNPFLKKYLERNWEDESKEFSFHFSEKVQESFDKKINHLISHASYIKKIFSTEYKLVENNHSNFVDKIESQDLIIHLFDSGNNLLYWNENSFLDYIDQSYENKIGQAFFINKKGKVYLTFIDTIEVINKSYFLVSSKIIANSINIGQKKETMIDSLKNNLDTEVIFDFDESANLIKDGRKYSFPILNNFKNKIGVATINKPTLSFAQQEIDKKTKIAQSILIILSIYILFIFVNCKINSGNLIRWITYSCEIILLRVALFYFEIPSSFWKSELTNPVNYSSRFGYGIVSSPFEFFVTAVSLFSIVLLYKRMIESNFVQNLVMISKNRYLKYFLSVLVIFLIMLIWRACGASIRSVVFDSNIRYFKEFQLIPEPVVALMSLNILLLGLLIIFSSTILFNILIAILKIKRQNSFLIFIIIQIVGLLFDQIQLQPQGTNLIRFVFFSSVYLLAVFNQSKNYLSIHNFIWFAFSASIISVSLLTYYNSELERESLKNTAFDFIRIKEPQLKFMMFQTLQEASNELINYEKENIDYDFVAFQIWEKSFFRKEGIETSINFLDDNKNYLGGFNSFSDQNRMIDFENIKLSNEIYVGKYNMLYGDNISLYGIMPISTATQKSYVLISINILNSIPRKNNFSIFRQESNVISSSLNFDDIKIFVLNNVGKIYSDEIINLNDYDIKKIQEMFIKKINESWERIELFKEKYYAYFLNDNLNGEGQVICVAKPEKHFSWNLSDFFKIFFIHAFIVSIFLVLFLLLNFKKLFRDIFSFKTKLALSLFLLSLLPMIFISNYIRNLIDENNQKIIRESLKEKIVQAKNVIDKKLATQTLNEKAIYKSINDEYGICFSIYKDNRLQYSSFIDLYSSGLTSYNLSYNAFKNLKNNDSKIFFARENITGKNYNMVFCTLINGEILEINELTNPIKLALSKLDFDVFLFGVFSLLLIIIMIISTTLSLQISKPVNILTKATKSIADGDLDYEIHIKTNDEFKDLAIAFNTMTKKLKQSQIELAQFEREEAWKEMAKQVAHEIKNPLTPMKLSVQQLIAAYKDKSNKFEEIFKKVTDTILLQIETLKNIASEFSNFARMPKMNIDKIDVVKAINEAIMLFVDEKKYVNFIYPNQNIFVLADEDHLKRTIINMIRNSFQANASKVIIELFSDDLSAVIKIIDNGNGIDESILSKIYDYNFTTKEKGMGLGLSMAKKYLESLNGSIMVESTNKNGTTFLIKIPLHKV